MDTPFTIQDIIPLLDTTVIKKDTQAPYSINDLGIICGLLTMNNEIEIVVKFSDHISQLTRFEYESAYTHLTPTPL